MPRSRPPLDDDEFGVAVRRLGGELRIAVSGELDLATGPQLLRALGAHDRDDDPGDDSGDDSGEDLDLILDLSGVAFIDAAGLRAILQITAGRRGAIIDPSPSVERLLQLTGIPSRFGGS